MIDIHCHIIPGLDDGAQDLEESFAMARQAIAQGIDTIIATPHHRNGNFHNEKQDIVQCVMYLNHQLKKARIPLTILAGQETRINGNMPEQLRQNELISLNQMGNYLFVELPYDHVPRYTNQLLFELQVEGVTPIIVHPERNVQITEDPDILYDFVRRGTLTQITAGSIAGEFGKRIQRFSHQLVEANLAHFIASDAHNTTTRGFCMSAAYAVLQEKCGSESAFELMENAERLVEGKPVIGKEPEYIRKKKILGVF